jgi:enoyl-CoA hydratase/carnithine racemase
MSTATSSEHQFIIVDSPADHVSRITLNRPDKRNALSHGLRTELFNALRHADASSLFVAVAPVFLLGTTLRRIRKKHHRGR